MFSRLDKEIALCKQHLHASSSEGTLIESIVVGYILSMFYAITEEAVLNSIYERCRVGMDQPSERFLKHAVRRVVRSIKVTDLSGVLGILCDTYKENFQQEMKRDGGRATTYYDNLLSNRHALVHQASVNATMKDIDEWEPLAKSVITEFRKAMGL